MAGIEGLGGAGAQALRGATMGQMPAGVPGAGDAGFEDALDNALSAVNGAQANAGAKTMALVTGQDVPLHEVMAAVTEAELAVQLTTAIATKAIQAYQEIWRMEV